MAFANFSDDFHEEENPLKKRIRFPVALKKSFVKRNYPENWDKIVSTSHKISCPQARISSNNTNSNDNNNNKIN